MKIMWFLNFTLFSHFNHIIFIILLHCWAPDPDPGPKSHIFVIFLVIFFSYYFHIIVYPWAGAPVHTAIFERYGPGCHRASDTRIARSTEPMEILWKNMKFHRNPWKYVNNYENPWHMCKYIYNYIYIYISAGSPFRGGTGLRSILLQIAYPKSF